MTKCVSRRRFVQSGLAGVGFWTLSSAAPAAPKSANEKVQIACVGVGGKGSSDTDQAGRHGTIVALCDIDEQRLGEKADKFKQARKFHDFRKMLDEMQQQIDAVVVSTPDHTHAPAAVMAMRLGKHVYCQKPLAHSVYEARLMRETAAKQRVATQMGNQGTASDGFRMAVEIVQSGAIGAVREVHVWTNRPAQYWKQAPDIVARPKDTPPVPKHIHWDAFLGPAPVRPYHPVYHPMSWRGFWDFGTGAMGDMACHTANLAFMALKLGLPTRVAAQSGEINPETYPAWATITYEFPARAELPAVKLIWYEGSRDGKRNLPPAELAATKELPTSGLILIGDEGSLFSPNDYGGSHVLLPKEKFADYKAPEPRLPRLGGDIDDQMKAEWVRAIQGGPPPMSNFAYSGSLTEAMLLGNVAIRVGKPLEYDADTMTVTNGSAAAPFLKPEFRKGWEI